MNLAPYRAAVMRAANCLLIAYSEPAALASLTVFVRELARVVQIPALRIPHKVRAVPIPRARLAYWQALDAWCSAPEDLRAYLAQDRARATFEHSLGHAQGNADRLLVASKPRRQQKTLPQRAHAPETYIQLKRAPSESVRELSNGSAVMAGLQPHSARDLSMRAVRAASVLAAIRGKKYYQTRRQISELIAECEAMSDDSIAHYLAR